MSLFVSKKSEEILLRFTLTVRDNVVGVIERYTLNELRVALQELSPSSVNAPELKAIEDRIEELEVERRKNLQAPNPTTDKPLQKLTRKQKLTNKQKSNPNDGMSEIDKLHWRPPSGTFIFPKPIKIDFSEEYSTKRTKRKKTRNYKFCIIWNDAELKELDVKDYSQTDSLFNLFLASKEDNPVITKREIGKYLETKQPPNRAIRDINDALVKKLRRKFPKQRDRIPDLIIGYSKKEDGYISLIPINKESKLDTLDKEEHILGDPAKEFLNGVRVMKRGDKKM